MLPPPCVLKSILYVCVFIPVLHLGSSEPFFFFFFRFLNGCSYVGASLEKLCVPNAFGGISGFDADAIHVFPQGVLVAITLIGHGVGDSGATAGAMCEAGLPVCSVAVTTLSGTGSDHKLLEQKL